ncbi:MAG TPA: TIGR03560 family F420-dependent LLM class oxidoreductase [Candidatus Limnocylindria bacterium]
MPHWGINLPAQHTTWGELRDTVALVDRLGFDSVWTWDHFVPLDGDPKGPMFEAWELLAAWGALTSTVRLGTLVTGNTYRYPPVLAKMVATLDHITGGRAMLGLGAAWHEGEHAMYGIPFPSTGGRLARMDEAARTLRLLLDEPVASFAGKHYVLTDAVAEPKPVQRRLPLLIGGGGEQKTLRTVAKYADYWHGHGTPEVIAHKLEVLARHCADVGRDVRDITPLTTIRPDLVLRDDVRAVESQLERVRARSKATEPVQMNSIHTVDAVVERCVELWRAGARGFILYFKAPFDHETIERLATDVRPKVLEAIA